MSAPDLFVAQNGQGSIGADNLNSLIQACDNIAQLRAFIGIQGMEVQARGSVVPGDGGGGFYYWSPTATAIDDGVFCVRPNGVITGAWLRLPLGGVYSPTFELLGGTPPTSLEVIGMHTVVAPCIFPTGFEGSTGFALSNPTATFTATIYRNGNATIVGTMSVATNGLFTFTTNGNASQTFAIGETLVFIAQLTPDATLANFCWSLLGTLI